MPPSHSTAYPPLLQTMVMRGKYFQRICIFAQKQQPFLSVCKKRSFIWHPQLECQISQFLTKKVMLYTIFTNCSSWFQPCNYWNDRKAEIRGQPVFGHHRPSLPSCFGSNEGFESSFVTAETGGRAWPMVPKDWLPSDFGLPIISTITWLKPAWKARKNGV